MSYINRYSDIIIAAAVVAIVVMMVVPLPFSLLDTLLAFNMTLALVILLLTMYNREPLQFSIFPSLLLITTLFRLALNVSSTRLILLHAKAGSIINAFGQFVVGGNPVVGFIIFIILAIIQFVVITRGAERVAEVAARFTLDAMPGKQMSIDADLNSGLIDDEEARRRRREIEREADFYGAMDGASKFVKGDAIAAVIITVINLLGGFAVGMVQQGMSAGEALSTYSLLTVGDGLVSQIPALLISTATGIIVTRAASENNLGADLTRQLFAEPRALGIAAVVLAVFGLVPGLPFVPFFLLAVVAGTMAYGLQRDELKRAAEPAEAPREASVQGPEDVSSLISVDPIEVELGYGLIPLADSDDGGDLLDRIVMIRRQCATDMGLLVPPVRIRDNIQLKPREYCLKLRGVEVSRGEIYPDRYMAMDPGTADGVIEGIETKEPAFGLPAVWIAREKRDEAEVLGYTVVDPSTVLATHLSEVIKERAGEVLGRQETKNLIEQVRKTHPAVVEDLVPDVLTLGEVQRVLRNLLEEGIPIRNLVTIFESLADYGRVTKDTELLTEYVRQNLRRLITTHFGLDRGTARVITLDPELEEVFAGAAEEGEGRVPLPPAQLDRFFQSLREQQEKSLGRGDKPVLLCSPKVRRYVRRLTERAAPHLIVLSYNELDNGVKVESQGMVRIK